MMTLREIFDQIESTRFAIEANAASTLRVFIDAVRSDQAVLELESRIRNKAFDPVLLVDRIKVLQSFATDLRYESPHDVALSAYLWVLEITAPDLSPLAAETVLSIPQIWWARHTASLILRDRRNVSAESDTHVADFVSIVPQEWAAKLSGAMVKLSYGQRPNVNCVFVSFHSKEPLNIQRHVSFDAISAANSREPITSSAAKMIVPVRTSLTGTRENNKIEWSR